MPCIKPVTELRNYNKVLRDVSADSPVFLTKNGHGRFAIVDIGAYERLQAELSLAAELAKGERSARLGGWISVKDAEKALGL
jgi:prevent-host-death family protein